MSTANLGPLLRASLLPVRQTTVLLPAGAALALPLLMVGALDSGDVLTILRWTGILLGCALIAAVDDPSGEVLAASPYPRAVRTGARLVLVVAFAVPAWALAGLLVHWRQPWFPVLSVVLEAVGIAVVAVAIAAGLRAWRDLHRPSQLASMVLLVGVAGLEALPRWYDVNVVQAWGPHWEAAHIRWVSVTVLGLAVVVAAFRDPLRHS